MNMIYELRDGHSSHRHRHSHNSERASEQTRKQSKKDNFLPISSGVKCGNVDYARLMYLMSTIMFSMRASASATVAWSVPMPVSLTGEHNNLFDLAIESHYIRMVKSETEKSVYGLQEHRNLTAFPFRH